MGFSCGDCMTSFAKSVFVGLSAVSCLFFMIGALGYTHEKDTMKNIPWFYGTYDDINSSNNKIYYTLKGAYFTKADTRGDYSMDANNLNMYKKCNTDGYSAYVLVVIACISSLCCAFLSGVLIKNDFTFGQFIGAGLAGLATFMSGIALAVFMGDCQNAVEKYYDDNAGDGSMDHQWGSGAILTAVGMVLMFVVSLGMFLTAKFCSGGAAAAKGNKIPDTAIDGDNPWPAV